MLDVILDEAFEPPPRSCITLGSTSKVENLSFNPVTVSTKDAPYLSGGVAMVEARIFIVNSYPAQSAAALLGLQDFLSEEGNLRGLHPHLIPSDHTIR